MSKKQPKKPNCVGCGHPFKDHNDPYGTQGCWHIDTVSGQKTCCQCPGYEVPKVKPEFYYRVEGRSEASWDEERERFYNEHLNLHIREYRVLAHTPKGVWLDHFGQKRFVLTEARKKFACPTREEALESFRKRKQRQAKILRAQLRDVENYIVLADRVTPEKLNSSTYPLASTGSLSFALGGVN